MKQEIKLYSVIQNITQRNNIKKKFEKLQVKEDRVRKSICLIEVLGENIRKNEKVSV